MTSPIEFNINIRESAGKSIARSLRNQNQLPIIVYGGKSGDVKASIATNEFVKTYQQGGILTKLALLKADKKEIKAIAREVQTDPVSDLPIHVDFQEVSEGTLVKVNLPVHVYGEEKCPGLKRGGVMNIALRYVLCNCNPESIPEYISVNLEGMQIGQNKHIEDIELPEGVTPIDESNFTLVSVSGRVEEKEEEETTEGEGEEATEEKKD